MNSFEFTIKRKIVLMVALKKLRLFSFHTVAICSVCRKYHKSTVDQSPWVAEEIEDNAEDAGTMEGIANRCERTSPSSKIQPQAIIIQRKYNGEGERLTTA